MLAECRAQVVEAGEIPVRMDRRARMERPCRAAPVTRFGVKIADEAGGVAGVFQRVEHLDHRGEVLAMPAIVQLEAADVEVRPALVDAVLRKGQGLGRILEPAAGALGIHAPRPGADHAIAAAAGFGQGQRAEDVGRHAHFRRRRHRRPFAGGRGLVSGIGRGLRHRRERQPEQHRKTPHQPHMRHPCPLQDRDSTAGLRNPCAQAKSSRQNSSPETRASTSSRVLYMAKLARAEAGMP